MIPIYIDVIIVAVTTYSHSPLFFSFNFSFSTDGDCLKCSPFHLLQFLFTQKLARLNSLLQKRWLSEAEFSSFKLGQISNGIILKSEKRVMALPSSYNLSF